MASNIDILLDKSSGLLLGGSAPAGVLPSFTRNDVYPFRIRVLERNANGAYTDAVLSSPSFSLGIGNIDSMPTDGQFKLTTTTGTSTAISFNATTAQVLNAVSAIAGNVTVTTYGSSEGSWIITAATSNTALSFGGLPFTLFPASAIQINTRRAPTASVFAQQIISLGRNPAVFSDSFSSVSGDGISLTKIQDGSSTTNETYALSIGNDVYGGSYSLAYGGFSVGIDYNQTPLNVATILSAITGIGSNNISVQSDSKRGLIISFVNALGLQNVSTELTLDSSGVQVYNWYSATVTMSTSEIEELFNEAGTDTITPTLEIEMTENGQTKTLLQYTTSISKDLILTGALVPADLALYYTKAQVDAGFIADSATNVNAVNRALKSSSGVTAVNYGGRTLVNAAGSTVVSFGTGLQLSGNIGFYGATVTAQPSGTNIVSGLTNLGLISYTQPTGTNIVSGLTNIGLISYTQPTAVNVVSGLINTGLIASGATYGVLPQSPRTLTAVTFFGPVTVGGNDVNSTTVSIVGVQPNDICMLGLPTDITEGITFFSHCVTAGQVHIDLLNVTGGQKIQTAATYRITVIGY
jgi:hypothetical protein